MMAELCVLVSGLPASGKSTTAIALAKGLKLRCFDKDDILESLFASHGIGDSRWRQYLSRQSDIEFQRQVSAVESAVVVSHWRAPGNIEVSGTPTEWLHQHFVSIIQVHCQSTPEIAARRFVSRSRHPGHLDHLRSPAEILDWMLSLAAQCQINFPARFDIDAFNKQDLQELLTKLKRLKIS